jgi:polygalacturonase
MALTKASFSMITGTPVNVKDFGAVGDGIADDFLAINRAVKYVADQGGGTVYYPPGTYRITRSIRLDDFFITWIH